jgi:hypothetical protein
MNRSQRIHDLRNVYHDFKIVLDLIHNGYSFNDEDAPAIVQQLTKALGVLQKEIQILENSD